jgi:ectoine hydroxylase-related dioxygenase (phytanoyl-CoA dioxygenase family)
MIKEALLPTEKDVQFYQQNGYFIAPKIIEDEFLDRIRDAMKKIYDGEYETGREPWGGRWTKPENPHAVWKMDQSHWSNNTMRELATFDMIGAIAAKLSGASCIRLWHDQLLFKPGQKGTPSAAGGNVGWHQDNNYWQCAPDTLLTAWVAFDDVTLDNGCMQVVPESHKWGLLQGDFFNQDLDSMKADMEQKTGREFKTVPLAMKAGQVSYHHCLTIHGSGPNKTDKPRRSLAVHLHPGDATYIAGTPNDNHMNAILMRQLGRKHGDHFAGEYWPTLYPVAGA